MLRILRPHRRNAPRSRAPVRSLEKVTVDRFCAQSATAGGSASLDARSVTGLCTTGDLLRSPSPAAAWPSPPSRSPVAGIAASRRPARHRPPPGGGAARLRHPLRHVMAGPASRLVCRLRRLGCVRCFVRPALGGCAGAQADAVRCPCAGACWTPLWRAVLPDHLMVGFADRISKEGPAGPPAWGMVHRWRHGRIFLRRPAAFRAWQGDDACQRCRRYGIRPGLADLVRGPSSGAGW